MTFIYTIVCTCSYVAIQFSFMLLEIPLFHIMTAKVTFGNINGVDSPATHVTLHDASEDHVTTMISMASSSSGADGLKKRHHSGSTSSQPQEAPADPTGTNIIIKMRSYFYCIILMNKMLVSLRNSPHVNSPNPSTVNT